MIKVLNDGTVSAWRDHSGSPILLDLEEGGGAKICVMPQGRNPELRYDDCTLRPTSDNRQLDGLRAQVDGGDCSSYEFMFDMPPRGYAFPWHYKLMMRLIADSRSLSYQLVLSRSEHCTEPSLMEVRFGILPRFASHGGAWCVRRNEMGIADQQNENPKVGVIFNPQADQVNLDTVRGQVSIGPRSGFDGFHLQAPAHRNYVCLAPIAGLYSTIALAPGEMALAATTILYTPHG